MFCEDTLCQIWIFVCSRVTLLETYSIAKFHEILMSSCLENSSFSLKQPVTIFLVKCACVAFNWVSTAKIKSMQKGLALHVITFLVRWWKKKGSQTRHWIILRAKLCDPFDIKLRDHFIDTIFYLPQPYCALTIIIKRMNLSSVLKLCSATLTAVCSPVFSKHDILALWFNHDLTLQFTHKLISQSKYFLKCAVNSFLSYIFFFTS